MHRPHNHHQLHQQRTHKLQVRFPLFPLKNLTNLNDNDGFENLIQPSLQALQIIEEDLDIGSNIESKLNINSSTYLYSTRLKFKYHVGSIKQSNVNYIKTQNKYNNNANSTMHNIFPVNINGQITTNHEQVW